MRRRRTVVAVAVLATAATAGAGLVAAALWSANGVVSPAAVPFGAVSFAARGQSGPTAQDQYSTDGGPVTVVLPGSEVARVLDATGPDPDPVIWRFTVSGLAPGITGLELDVTVTSQVTADGEVLPITSGAAADGTVLALARTTVYPASSSGDCSTVPDTSAVDAAQDVVVVGGESAVLQAAGASTGQMTEQVWCVAMLARVTPDGAYANEVQAVGTGQDGSTSSAISDWRAVVGFPLSLDALGPYRNHVDAVGVAEDGTASRAGDDYEARVYPDPAAEPSVVLALDPTVTNLNPAIATGDHSGL